jgi:hypothetical protein
MRWVGYVARMERINAYKTLLKKPEGKRTLERYKRKWKDNTNVKVTIG